MEPRVPPPTGLVKNRKIKKQNKKKAGEKMRRFFLVGVLMVSETCVVRKEKRRIRPLSSRSPFV